MNEGMKMTNGKAAIGRALPDLLLGLRFLFAAFLIWRTAPLLTGFEAIGLEHNVPGALILLIAVWEIAAALLFGMPRGLSWSSTGLLWGTLGLLGVFIVVAAVSIHAGTGYFQLIVYGAIVVALYAGERWLGEEPAITYF